MSTPQPSFGAIVPRPIIGVGAVVFRQHEVLLIRRGTPPHQGAWSIPGGRQELGETVFETARREIFEETGIEIEVLDLIDVVDLIDRDPVTAEVMVHYTLIDVLAIHVAGEARQTSEAVDVIWLKPEEVSSLPLWSETVRIVRRAQEMMALRSSSR